MVDGVAIIAIPSLLRGTAGFAYRERGLFIINLVPDSDDRCQKIDLSGLCRLPFSSCR
jgi:hypothetical protein